MRVLLSLFCLFIMAAPAQAAFTCTHGFTLERQADGWLLSGALDVPTAGYRYSIGDNGSIRPEIVRLPLKLHAPDGAAAMMIATLPVQERIAAGADLLRLTVSIDKDFNWGPDIIDCAIQRSIDE